jgi:hypothetical protein
MQKTSPPMPSNPTQLELKRIQTAMLDVGVLLFSLEQSEAVQMYAAILGLSPEDLLSRVVLELGDSDADVPGHVEKAVGAE